MKRSGFDERRDHQIAAEYHAGHMACSFCNTQTPKDELSAFGARCKVCYDEYCGQGRHYPALTPQQRRAMTDKVRAALSGRLRLSGTDHIAQLQRRADAGENLSPGQRGFLAAVRRASGRVDDEPAASATAAPAASQPAEPMVPIVIGSAPAAHVEQWPAVDEPPDWAIEDAGLSDAAEFPAPNDVSVTV